MKILILGGYGTFGGRLAELLAGDERLTLLIAGRSEAKAKDFCSRLRSAAAAVPLVFDRDGDVEAQVRAIDPDLIVDASGPFQRYGDDPYRVVKACIAQDAHYVDLADAAAFVEGIAQFDAAAKERNLYVLSGVSTFPVLTAAVVRHLSRGAAKVTDISAGLAPSAFAGVGLNVIRAIAGYAGKPVSLIRDGTRATGFALVDSCRYTIAPPGCLPLRSTRFSLVDVPDLQILPGMWPGLHSIWMGAGPVPEVLHRMLNGLAWLVRLRVLPSLSFLAPLFHAASNTLRWGEHRGGMFIAIRAQRYDGASVERSWHLVAEGDDGPYIPSMAVAAIVRRVLDGRTPEAGARPCTNDLDLEDYDALFASRRIRTGERERVPGVEGAPLYREILGSALDSLPEPIRAVRDRAGSLQLEGVGSVERGRSWLATIAAMAGGFPPTAASVPVSVSFRPRDGGEVLLRKFRDRSFSSVLACGKGYSEGLLSERFGPLSFDMALTVDGEKLALIVRRWSLLGLPLPIALAPKGDAYEYAADGRYHFHVEIGHPMTGLIVRYRGWLAPSAASAE